MKRKIKTTIELKALYKSAKSKVAPTPVEARQRGYDLESVLEFLLIGDELRASYKTDSEQIDGSFFKWGQTFLLEAKWHKDPMPVSSLYMFKGKLDGKFHTSSGIFIAINGYSKEAVNALRYGKAINMLLFDGKDLDAIIENDVPFIDVLKYKLRMAGDTGSPFAAYNLVGATHSLTQKSPTLSGTTVSSFTGSSPVNQFISQPLYLVFYSEYFSDYNIQHFFSGLPTQQIQAFQFQALKDSENPLDVIPIITNLYAANSEGSAIKGIIVVLNESVNADNQNTQLRLSLPEILRQNVISVPTGIFNISESDLMEFPEFKIKHSAGIIGAILRFMEDQIQTEHFFYDDDAVYEAIREALDNAEWDYENRTVNITDTYNPDEIIRLNSYEELAAHLSTIADEAAASETPLDILKEDNRPDYDEVVFKILNLYDDRLKQLHWKNQ